MNVPAKNGAAGAVAIPDDFANALGSGIAESRATTQLASGKPFLRMMKSGDWVFGQTNEEVQEGSQWVVNIMSLAHGYCCWVDTGNKNELKGEVMVSMTHPKPVKPAPIDGKGFEEQRSFDLKCILGDDAGVEVLFKTNSLGGMKEVDQLLSTIQKRLATPEGRLYPCPVLELGSDHYDHSKYGRIYTPVLTVVSWANMMGELEVDAVRQIATDEGASEADTAPAAPPAPTKAKKAAVGAAGTKAAAKPAVKAPEPAPAPTQRQHVGQRRRPAAR